MTEGGISKTVFFGLMVGAKLADMALAEEDPKSRIYFFFGMVALVIIYWGKQTFLEYKKNDARTGQEIS